MNEPEKVTVTAAGGAAGHDEPNRAEVVLGRMTEFGKRVLVFTSVALALAVFTVVAWFTFGDFWVRQVNQTVDQNTAKGFGYGTLLSFILVYFAFIMLRFAIMRKMPGSGRIAFSVIAGLLLVVPLFSLFITLNPQHSYAFRIRGDAPGYQAGMLVGTFIALAAFVVTWVSLHNINKKRAAAKAIKVAEKDAARAAKEEARLAEEQAEAAAEQAKRDAAQAKRDEAQAKKAEARAARSGGAVAAEAPEAPGEGGASEAAATDVEYGTHGSDAAAGESVPPRP